MKEIIEDFRQGKLQIDFINLSLVQNNAANPISYRGTGYIRQTDEDQLSVRLYSVETQNTDLAKDFNSLMSTKPGALYKDADYYTLTGATLDGSTWKAEHILPHASWFAGNPNPIVNGSVARCERGKREAAGTRLRMHYFEKADLPCLIDVAKFTACDLEFDIKKEEDSFTVGVSDKTALPESLAMKIEEALRFILAQTVSYRVLAGHNYLQLYSRSHKSRRTYLPPPIGRSGSAFHANTWQLFEAYLAYVMQGTEPYWHPCSNHLHNACEASANALDAWAIGLSVAVEGLAGLLPKELDPKIKKQLEALQDFINGRVARSRTHNAFAKRIAGMMNGLTQIRAIDRMNGLAESGGTTPALLKDWTKLRNRGVHPTKRGGNLTPTDFQRLIDEVHHVTVLMYHIVFALIGYKGPYTEYGVHGFPQRDYPPPATATPPEPLATAPVPKSAAKSDTASEPARRETKPAPTQPKKSTRKTRSPTKTTTRTKKTKLLRGPKTSTERRVSEKRRPTAR
jgi:hypothetical protein